MLGVDKGSDGPQYAVRKAYFLEWMEVNRPQQFAEYTEHQAMGGPAMWLNYLWLDGDTFIETGAMVSCVVPRADRRSYFRTYLTALIQNIPFYLVEEFSDDTSPVYVPTFHDGRLKLNSLLGVIDEGDEVIYIGSGLPTVATENVKTYAKLELIDPFGGSPGILSTYPIKGKIVINDAYYDGFVEDQRRLAEATKYYAKQAPVDKNDFLFILPGSSESRYTNDKRFSNVFLDYLAKVSVSTTRDSAAFFAIDKVMNRRAINVSRSDTLASRIELKNVTSLTGDKIPYRTCALFLPGDNFECGGKVHAKSYIVAEYKIIDIPQEERNYLSDLLVDFDKQGRKKQKRKGGQSRKSFYQTELEKYPVFQKMNWALVRGLDPVEITVYPCLTRQHVLERIYTIPPAVNYGTRLFGEKEFFSHIYREVGNEMLVHIECGDGEFSHQLKKKAPEGFRVAQHDIADNRIHKDTPLLEDYSMAQWLLVRHMLHKKKFKWKEEWNNFNVLIIDFDVKKHKREVQHIHEAGFCCCGDEVNLKFGLDSLRGIDIRSRGNSFGQFFGVRYKLGIGD